tara:strand:+ start:1663 stop:1893 length:231 start_codon:yes stop_codon:yes gene_type:complete
MTSLSLDHSNNIVAQAINISNQLNNLIQQLNPNNEVIEDIQKIIKKDLFVKQPAGAKSYLLSDNKANSLWRNSLRK